MIEIDFWDVTQFTMSMDDYKKSNKVYTDVDIDYEKVYEYTSNLDSINVSDEVAFKVKNGMILEFNTDKDLVCIINDDRLIAIYKRYDKDNTKMKPLKVFKEDYISGSI